MGCASSAPSTTMIKKKQKERRDQTKTAGGYNDAVANILDEAGNGVAGGGEGVVSFFAETNFRKLSDAEDYMKSRILDPSRKTTNKFIDKATTWAPDAGDYLEKKLMRDKTRFQNKLLEEKERKEKEKEKEREKEKEKEKKKLKSTLLEVTKGDKKKTKKDKIKSIKKAVRKSKKDEDSDDRSTSPGDSLLDAIAVVHERARKEKIKRALMSRKAAGLSLTADIAAAAKAAKKTEGEEEDKEQEKKPEDEIEPLDIASSRETLKPQGETIEAPPDSPIGYDSDIGADLKIEDLKIDDSASTVADTSVYETETDADDIYDDAGISASSVSLDDLMTVASDDDSSSDEASISTIADRRKEIKAPLEKAPKKIEETAEEHKATEQTE
ncbi:DNA ligase 1-like [Ischnura elegans]|uniref:DNA ligase 1-like n=1 Tax=Ischnura elegans TaxID=197161 RepID=UPI001ED8A812|nr:DNA ligase 1-like [Ischnura elegans]